jgi:microcystin-dependent protein
MAWTVSIKTWITGEIVTAAQLNTELKDRAQHLFDNLLPCGSVVPFAGSIAPSFYLFCNGQGAATTAWPTLFGLIGYTYGGSGTTFNMPDLKGRVPVGAGAGAGLTTRTLASIFGAENVATPLPQHAHGVSDPGHGHGNDAHDHHNDGANGNVFAISIGSGTDGVVSSGTPGRTNFITYTSEDSVTIGIHSGGSNIGIQNNGTPGATHSVVQPSLALNYLIKAI